MKITVIGTGYVGLVAGVCFADAGHSVICVDKDPSKVSSLREGQIPIYEPGLEEIMEGAIKRKRIQFTTDLAQGVSESSVIFIAVGTPEGPNGDAEMGPLMGVVEQISQSARDKKYVVLKSTVPVGTAKLVQTLFDQKSKFSVEVINNPEFLKEGAAIDDFLKPDRVVIGCRTEEAKQIMQELYDPFLKNGNPIFFMDNASAELTKYAANAFLSVKISFINELAQLADKVGADINQVRKGFTSDSRINPAFFYPGIGYGGSCFPKDVKALVRTGQKNDVAMKIVASADEVNFEQREVLFQKIKKHFGDLKGKQIALWGLSFKPRTDDVREAPALDLISKLSQAGAQICAFDPVASENAQKASDVKFQVASSAMEAVENADALVVVTEWNEFRNPNLEDLKKKLKQAVIFDGRNIFEPARMKQAGFKYYCFGRESLS
ncbi:MAG: UDP-glucose/GDP-mannose dehydrogenase family protein [Bdellovibrionales bacterium]